MVEELADPQNFFTAEAQRQPDPFKAKLALLAQNRVANPADEGQLAPSAQPSPARSITEVADLNA